MSRDSPGGSERPMLVEQGGEIEFQEEMPERL